MRPKTSSPKKYFGFFVVTLPRQNTKPVLLETSHRYPGSGRLHYESGRFYLTQDEPEDALYQFQEETRFAPELREPHIALGQYFLGNQEEMRAIQAYERALALEPEAADAYAALIPLYRSQNALGQLIG